MVHPLCHWIRVLFCTRSKIPLRELSGSWGIGFWIPLRVLSGFQVPLVLVVPTHHLLFPVRRSFELSISFFLLWHIWVSLLYGTISGGVFWHSLPGFSFPLPRIYGDGFVRYCLWPNKISCLLLEIFFDLPFCSICCLPLYCSLPTVWVVVGFPYLLGLSS